MAQEEREHNRSREKKVSKGLKMHDLSGEQQMVPCCWSRRYVGGGLWRQGTEAPGSSGGPLTQLFSGSGEGDGGASLTTPSG